MYGNGEYLLFKELVRERNEKIEKELDRLARCASDELEDDLSEGARRRLVRQLGGLLVTIGRKMQPAEGPELADDCGYAPADGELCI